MTGILFWDLSAAYDTLDTDILCKKLAVYGFDEKTCAWFKSFLNGRKQRVRVGKKMSKPIELVSGVPQGGILSPIIFTIYGADLEDWVKHSSIFNYADYSTSSCSGEDEDTIITKLEEDATGILEFMASNGLVANPDKTVFMMMNCKKREETEEKKDNMKVRYLEMKE